MSAEPASGALRYLPAGARSALANPAVRGVGLMFIATFFFSAMHGSIRYVSATIHPFEIALFRNVFALLVALPGFWRFGIGRCARGASACMSCARCSTSWRCCRSSMP